jgi:hypothetical protein
MSGNNTRRRRAWPQAADPKTMEQKCAARVNQHGSGTQPDPARGGGLRRLERGFNPGTVGFEPGTDGL